MSRSAGHYRHLNDHSFYFYEGEDLICQQDIGALVQDESQYEPKFLLLDHLGSTRAELVFDPVSLAPQIQEYYALMPYGEVIDPPTTQESVLFTGKKRDFAFGHDFFGARCYFNTCFRWSSPDSLFVDTLMDSPQSWNLYSYVRSNPVIFIDPDGRYTFDPNSSEEEKYNFRVGLNRAINALEGYDEGSIEHQKLERALSIYGDEGIANGIVVGFSNDPSILGGRTEFNPLTGKNGDQFGGAHILFNNSDNLSQINAQNIAHEGTHVSNYQRLILGQISDALFLSDFRIWDEVSAYHTSSLVGQRLGSYLNLRYNGIEYSLYTQRRRFTSDASLNNLNRFFQARYGRTAGSLEQIRTFLNAGN